MNIAVQAADLDADRIDGTRVYLSQLLKRFGMIDPSNQWHLYHRSAFNPELVPPTFPNYTVHTVTVPFYWTQTRFAWEMWKLRPEKLWMPVQALPFFLPKGIETTVTIHDLAFKYFPDHFPKKDQRRLHMFADFAVRKADKLIAVSESTKRDILKWYPDVDASKIRVIYHGFENGQQLTINTQQQSLSGHSELVEESSQNTGRSLDYAQDDKREVQDNILKKYSLETKKYLLYVGAIQPRKNILVLLEAFELEHKRHPDMKLVLAGEKAWLWKETVDMIEKHPFREDIIVTGKVSFRDLAALYAQAKMFVFPSLYEGFGIPVLEAMAAGTPVICSNNSSLPEVGGDAALYFEALNVSELASRIESLWTEESLCAAMIRRGYENIKKFSWDKCAKETMEYIIS
ncbi:MAG: glycosyltransferase family 1 protein [Candidatus Moranbacteria bacterium]|nr:glycosyltransferase family 1 protein [Candidatus Moranbacteria bacterium]